MTTFNEILAEIEQADAEGRLPMNVTPAEEVHVRKFSELDKRAVDGNDVCNLAPAKVIIPELGITEKSTVEIFGRMKSGKTFFTLDLACSVATGVPWRGHTLRPRRVLYLIGEGTPGLGSRIRAWKAARRGPGWNEPSLDMLTIQPTRLSLNNRDEFIALEAWVKARGPFGLVILDTLARYSSGVEENGSQMQMIVDRAESIRDAASTEAPLILVHHSGRGNSDHGRGHTSVESACDLIVRTTKDGVRMQAEVLENRHGPAGAVLRSTIESVPEARQTGEEHDPAVIVPDLATTTDFLPESRRHLLDVLELIQEGDQYVAAGRWQDAAEMTSSTFYRALKDLRVCGWVEVDDTGRYPRYRVKAQTASEQEF